MTHLAIFTLDKTGNINTAGQIYGDFRYFHNFALLPYQHKKEVLCKFESEEDLESDGSASVSVCLVQDFVPSFCTLQLH